MKGLECEVLKARASISPISQIQFITWWELMHVSGGVTHSKYLRGMSK